ALPILVAGECCLALLAVSCAILNAAGRTRASQALIAVAVVVGVASAAVLVPGAAPGQGTLIAAATATALGMATGFVGSVVYMRQRLGGKPPLGTVGRVALAVLAAVIAGRFLPAHGKVLGLAATVAIGIVYLAVLVASGEFGPADRAKFARILRRR
ncbi:MAG TPA: polysaccharide biosynthesis C-terminal domain-containing protein, partial [Polyangia bacterium]|nr:polysaccharide biosynthesis C-terminal domain-containing protein [Polyangia bacterium]